MSKIKMEETVAKFGEGGDGAWEIVENYHEMAGRLYIDGELVDQPVDEPCKHAINLVEEEDWQRESAGKTQVQKWVKWVVPRVVKKLADDPYYAVTICLDCLLEGVAKHYG
jgi:hypothetical protein